MLSSLEKLHKFLRLEAERGFDNRAVVGGLNKILAAWEPEARLDKVPEDLLQHISATINQYPDLDAEKRAESLRELWKEIQVREKTEKTVDLPQPRQAAQVRNGSLPADQPPAAFTAPKPAHDQVRIHNNDRSHRIPSGPAGAERIGLNAPLTVIQGIGPKYAETLSSLGMRTLGDMLYYFPRRYDDYSQLEPIIRLWYGQEVTVIATVQSITTRPLRGGSGSIVEAVVADGSGSLRVTWFNQPWIANRLVPGTGVVLSGKVDQYLGRLNMTSPEWEPLEQEHLHTNRIVPVYSLTAKVTQKWLRRIMFQTVSYWAPRVAEFLPEMVRRSTGLMDLQAALQEIHFPTSQEKLRSARQRLAFDEIFLMQLGVLRQKMEWQQAEARIFEVPEEWLAAQVAALPYELTAAQQQAVADVRMDLASGRPMNRLLQGDVGSGKTVVAALGMGIITTGGAQAAIMAPTSILAEQHFRSLITLLCRDGGLLQPGEIRLLIGDTPESEKKEIRQGLEDGSIKVVIGTHALIESPVAFKDLQMIVVDEQHRFGVDQRAALRSKGENPHLLVMTATPIPRSLALTIYGDLDLSVMDELPAGRQHIDTHVLTPRERERAYSLIRSQVEQGRQAFIIYPLVELGDDGSEEQEARAAVEEHSRLQEKVFPTLSLGLVHGRLKPEEKESVMAGFRDNQFQVLVSTSVVEVGVDVPNATVMLIEGANRFGLAQLHQFRGRVGRGEAKSYCLLIPDKEDNAENERLMAMTETNDGFVLAEKDLQQRGPGEFFGNRQSGFSGLNLANLSDVRMIEKARNEAQSIFQSDARLEKDEHKLLAETLDRFWGLGRGDLS